MMGRWWLAALALSIPVPAMALEQATRLYCHERHVLDTPGNRSIWFERQEWAIADGRVTVKLDGPIMQGTVHAVIGADGLEQPEVRFDFAEDRRRAPLAQMASSLLRSRPIGRALRPGEPFFQGNRAEAVGWGLSAFHRRTEVTVEPQADLIVVLAPAEDGRSIAGSGYAGAMVDGKPLLVHAWANADPATGLVLGETLTAEVRDSGATVLRQTSTLVCSPDEEATPDWPDMPRKLISPCQSAPEPPKDVRL